jgi:hypothetical protein
MAATDSFTPAYRPAGRDSFRSDSTARDAALQGDDRPSSDALEPSLNQVRDTAATFAALVDDAIDAALSSPEWPM